MKPIRLSNVLEHSVAERLALNAFREVEDALAAVQRTSELAKATTR